MKTYARFVLAAVLFFGCINASIAQLCTGSLGDPVVNITFGQGTSPGPPLAAGITNYGYVSTACPNDGYYNIGSSTTACFGDTWHTILEDHTPGDVNGFMMIANASNNPGTFYLDTVRGLCGGTTYEFAAWILNVIKPTACGGVTIKPNVTFNILTVTGTVLLTSQTGDIQPGPPTWKQYGAFFTTPDGQSSVVIQMINNATGGCGNDLLLDDITFRPCGALITSSLVGGASERDFCVGPNQPLSMTATVTPANNNALYQWQTSTNNGATWTDIAGANSLSYNTTLNTAAANTTLYRLAAGQGSNIGLTNCRVVSNLITVHVNANPTPAASNNGPRCEGDVLTLSASDGKDYTWTGPKWF